MDPKIGVALIFTGTGIDFDHLSSRLGVKATESRKKESWPQVSIDMGLAEDEWIYEILPKSSYSVSDEIDYVRTIFEDKTDAIISLLDDYAMEAAVTVIVKIYDGNRPEIGISTENVMFLSSIRASIGFEVQYFD